VYAHNIYVGIINNFRYTAIREDGEMLSSTIGKNLVRLRHAAGLTQKEMAELAQISATAYTNYESGRTAPPVNLLPILASSLKVGLEDLVTEPQELTCVRFRATKRLNTRAQILAGVSRWLQDYQEIEEVTGNHADWSLQPQFTDAACAAAETRRRWDIQPDEPIRNICGLLEGRGIKVWSTVVRSEYFFGLSVGPGDGGPAIVVNTWDRIPVERWIFSAAHELGHILLHADSFEVTEEKEVTEQEEQANVFAAHFLMPQDLFRKEWEQALGLPLLDRVFKIKRMFRVSYATVLYRLDELRYAQNVWQQFHAHYKRRFRHSLTRKDEPQPLAVEKWRAYEPKRLDDIDFTEDRLDLLVRDAVTRGLITRSRAAEILHVPLEHMLQRIEEWIA
jgi:Zn-dependent peptidase ImmA (M78 family)/DNA-binding XRE family transcriptional regulator